MVSNSYSHHPLSFKQVHKKVLNIFCPEKKEIVSQSQTQYRQAIFNPGCHLDHEPVFQKKVSLRSHPWKKQKSQLSLNVQNFFNITPWFPTAHGIELLALHDIVPTDFLPSSPLHLTFPGLFVLRTCQAWSYSRACAFAVPSTEDKLTPRFSCLPPF